jgi:hypothetical protein
VTAQTENASPVARPSMTLTERRVKTIDMFIAVRAETPGNNVERDFPKSRMPHHR